MGGIASDQVIRLRLTARSKNRYFGDQSASPRRFVTFSRKAQFGSYSGVVGFALGANPSCCSTCARRTTMLPSGRRLCTIPRAFRIIAWALCCLRWVSSAISSSFRNIDLGSLSFISDSISQRHSGRLRNGDISFWVRLKAITTGR